MLRVVSTTSTSHRRRQEQQQLPQMWCNNFVAWITSILSTFAFILLVVTASTCNFVSVVVVSSEELTTSKSSLPSSLGLSCPNYGGSSDTDTMSLISAIFLSVSIFIAFLCTIAAWYTVFRSSKNYTRSKNITVQQLQQQQLLPSFENHTMPTTINKPTKSSPTFISMSKLWFIQSILSAIAAITCIPIFVIYNSSICLDTSTNTSTATCQFGIGSYLTIVSCICLICITIVTKCNRHPSTPPNIRDVHVHKTSHYQTNLNTSVGRNNSLPLEQEELRPPSLWLNSMNSEEKVEEGMEVPYDQNLRSSATLAPTTFDPYNTTIVSSDDEDGSNDIASSTPLNSNNNLFCAPMAGIVAAVLSSGGVEATSTSSKDDAEEDDDIVTVEDDETHESNMDESQRRNNDAKSTHMSLLYSTSMMDGDDEEEDPVLIFPKNSANENNVDNMMHHGRSTNDATVKFNNTTAKNDHADNSTIIQRAADTIVLPNVSLLDADTTTVHDETSGSNFDLGSLEPSTINVKDSFMTEDEEHDINGDESILDNPETPPRPSPPEAIQHNDDEVMYGSSVLPQGNMPISNKKQIPVTALDPANNQMLESKKVHRSVFSKTHRLLDICRKPLQLRQHHAKHQQRGYQYLEDVEIDSLFQPIIMSPPLEILTVHSTRENKQGAKTTQKQSSALQQQQQSDDDLQLSSPLSSSERQENGLLYNEWYDLHNRTMQTYSDEPEPYLEFSDEELSDDDDANDDIRRGLDTGDNLYASEQLPGTFDGRKNQRLKGRTGGSRRRRRNPSSNRSVASSKTNLSLLTATIAEETSEDLHNDDNEDDVEESLLESNIVPLVRSRSVPNLATYYSTVKTNNEVYDEIHMTGIHHYRSAHIFPQSTGSSSSPNHRRNSRRNNHYHNYHPMENDSDQGSTSLLSIQRRRRHQLWYTSQNLNPSSARSVPDKFSHGMIQRKAPLFRAERAQLGIHYIKNDEPSTSSSSDNSGDNHVAVTRNDSLLLPSQKARLARFQRLQQQQQQQNHSLNLSASSSTDLEATSSKLTLKIPIDHPVKETVKNDVPLQLYEKKDKNETTISTAPDDSIDIDVDIVDESNRHKTSAAAHHTRSFSTSSGSSGGGTNNTHRNNDILIVGDGDDVLINYDRRRHTANPTDLSFDSNSTNSLGMNNENDSSYMIDLLDVQLAELNRPDGALIGPDEASM